MPNLVLSTQDSCFFFILPCNSVNPPSLILNEFAIFSGHTIGKYFCVFSARFAKMTHKEWNIDLKFRSNFLCISRTNLHTRTTQLWVNKILVLRLKEKITTECWKDLKGTFRIHWRVLDPNTCIYKATKLKPIPLPFLWTFGINWRRVFFVNYDKTL